MGGGSRVVIVPRVQKEGSVTWMSMWGFRTLYMERLNQVDPAQAEALYQFTIESHPICLLFAACLLRRDRTAGTATLRALRIGLRKNSGASLDGLLLRSVFVHSSR